MPRLKDHNLVERKLPAKREPVTKKDGWVQKQNGRGFAPGSSSYNEAIGDEICERLAAKESLASICQSPGMPHPSTVLKWVAGRAPPHFKEKYEAARNIGYQLMAEEILAIADDGSNDYVDIGEDGKSKLVVDHDHIARSRLRVETRKWVLCHMLPKMFGDKLKLQGDENAPIQHNHAIGWMTEDEAKKRGWA